MQPRGRPDVFGVAATLARPAIDATQGGLDPDVEAGRQRCAAEAGGTAGSSATCAYKGEPTSAEHVPPAVGLLRHVRDAASAAERASTAGADVRRAQTQAESAGPWDARRCGRAAKGTAAAGEHAKGEWAYATIR